MIKKSVIAVVTCLSLIGFAEKSEAASLAEILGIVADDVVIDGTNVDLGNINFFSNSGTGSGSSGSTSTTTNNFNGPVITNNFFGSFVNNFFSGPTFNFTPSSGNGGVQLPNFGGTFLPIFNPIIIVGPVNINITINITIINRPMSVARCSGF